MDLLVKVGIIAVIVVALIAGIFLLLNQSKIVSSALTAEETEALIVNDLKQHSASSIITVINVSNSTVHSGSFSVVVRVVNNQSSACPSVITQTFDYPATGLLNTTQVYSNYSNGVCKVYVNFNSKSAFVNDIVGLPAIAIAMPYNDSFLPLLNYINQYGYNSIHTNAGFVSSLNFSNSTLQNVWVVNYTASNANYSYYIILNDSGNIMYNYTKSR